VIHANGLAAWLVKNKMVRVVRMLQFTASVTGQSTLCVGKTTFLRIREYIVEMPLKNVLLVLLPILLGQ
jgi:hypothetical protein